MKKKISLHVEKYIAKPYWPEAEFLIKLEQKARLHPKHAPDKRKLLLQTYLEDNDIDPNMVEAARKKVQEEKWYRNKDGEIFIPRHQLAGALVQALRTHPLKKELDKDQLRSFIQVGDLEITPVKTKYDVLFERYIKHAESNMRRLEVDEVIQDFDASGEIEFEDDFLNAGMVESLLRYCGKWVGIGSARKMAYGHFTLEGW